VIDRHAAGELPPKHHIAFRGPDGALRFEECITRQGFDGPYTIAYHLGKPHTARSVGTVDLWPLPEDAGGLRPLKRRHFLGLGVHRGGPAMQARTPLLFNADVVLSTLDPDAPDPAYLVNGDGDDLYFIFEGSGVLVTALGDLRFAKNDYVFVPKGIVHRFVPDSGVAQRWLSIECLGGMHLPRQWRNEVGQLRMDAPYCHRDFRPPAFEGPRDEGLRDVIVKRDGAFHRTVHDHSPLDVVGWDGSVWPWIFPILAFQPRAGLVHLPPTWHGTFAARGALVCSFVPRVVDFHPDAIPCPYPHASVDCDEFIFYCDGNFTSRKGVGPGSMSLHPMGVPHGPHPGAYERSIGTARTDELAVMLDTFLPLRLTKEALGIEDAGYHDTFID
jgi:homogentisate 1,2-dioxygenase